MKRIAVFPGSFDPITRGHESLVRRALPLFDELIVAIGVNSTKNYFYPLEKRKAWIEQTFADCPNVRVETFSGLTVEFCKKNNAGFILRGIRSGGDFEFETPIAQMNKGLGGIETVFLVPLPELSAISSTILRDIVRHGGDASALVPAAVDLNK